jgi:hypothetical protein
LLKRGKKRGKKDVDARDKRGHDDGVLIPTHRNLLSNN